MSSFPTPEELSVTVFEALKTKAMQPPGHIAVLGMLAGIYIGLGGVFSTLALAGADSIAFGLAQVVSGLVFSLGLAAVVLAGAELFTGNTLLAGPVAFGQIPKSKAFSALIVAYGANLVGSLVLVFAVFLAGFHEAGDGAVGRAAIDIASTKTDKSFATTVASGVIANFLVCLGVWLALAGDTITQKLAGLILPISAFVAAGFEHSIANMFLLPYGYLVEHNTADAAQLAITPIASNILASTIGNIIGGSALALSYGYLYQRRHCR